MKTTIGTTSNGKHFNIDVDVLVDTRALICASSGAGKTWLLRLLAENVADKVPTIIIDPEGEFSTLREKLDILIVGENGDIKPDIKSAGLLARKLAETGISAVLDIYDLPGKGDPWEKRRLFVYAFLTGLMNIPKNLYHPMLIAIDEAHNFTMESPSKGGRELAQQYFKVNESPSILSRSAVRTLMSAGRKRGMGGLLATQRVSKIDKDSIADARNIFIGGTSLDIDQERAGDMLGMSKKESVLLRELEAGEFHCFGPALGSRGVFRFQSAMVKTTHLKAGQRLNIEVPKASTQISKIVSQFGDLPQELETEIQTAEQLKTEITRLKRELSVRPVQVQPETRIERVEVPVLTQGNISDLAALILSMNEEAKSILEIGSKISEAGKTISSAVDSWKAFKGNGHFPFPVHTPILTNTQVSDKKTVSKNIHDVDDKLTNPEQRILDAIAWFESIGIFEPRQEAVAFLAGYTFGGGAFNNPRGKLNTRGFVSYKGKNISLTETGRNFSNSPISPLTQEELHRHIYSVLPKPHRAIMEVLISMEGNQISKDELSEIVGKRGGAFNNPLGRLRSFGLIDYPERGTVAALPFLFMR